MGGNAGSMGNRVNANFSARSGRMGLPMGGYGGGQAAVPHNGMGNNVTADLSAIGGRGGLLGMGMMQGLPQTGGPGAAMPPQGVPGAGPGNMHPQPQQPPQMGGQMPPMDGPADMAGQNYVDAQYAALSGRGNGPFGPAGANAGYPVQYAVNKNMNNPYAQSNSYANVAIGPDGVQRLR